MPSMSYARYCAEIVAQTDLLRSRIEGADLATPVPTCPDWNLGQLLWHLGGAHRWAETIVRTRAAEPVSDELVNDVSGATGKDPAAVDAWLAEGAGQLAATLRAAGPQAQVWTVAPGGTPEFWARRMVHETVVHRADATFTIAAASPAPRTTAPAAGAPAFTLAQEVAIDALEEWMGFASLPLVFEAKPELRDLMSEGRTLHFHATDTAPETAAEWLVGLDGDTLTWSRTHARATVAVRAPAAAAVTATTAATASRSSETCRCSMPGSTASASGSRSEGRGHMARSKRHRRSTHASSTQVRPTPHAAP
ncbi:maleylpyruvate isomerase N-terminal domain-containing protein [Streptomyces sp. Je 1-4]|uniref:maleylpyruvate isomerase N-terminal domain-containing protein n=1 Tax=Streptomyces TaxID=1883 RepID=UPI0021D86D28|nr:MULTISPECIES: maleylpyruvate isomerase N-terminal domain-containing protein [unclassified Streptomyces]UYB40678.1 maleylpyruvate isomerase N-terminal domain-containing protein [Streptomyces sp. Je 1-4]UZQ36817.1 maleylpyruvate isomerase N-terminal domain-containing protein [Streptomyces sp. Je 1-4] [Streptomyces sp. Je 1-4 4N24]UZQ44234.1 maleylpyruvate isomerase N-terminal domain-containing protein [Streptomyces sp. Je 1-4] [Streptomyces sp. Je 1-4 4N24_ara]